MQGRLVASATGALDCPPGWRWREEFPIAALLGLHHIELVAERAPDPSSPIWSSEGRAEIVTVAADAGVRTASLCVNETLARPFDDRRGALGLATRLAPVLAALRPGVVVLPLLEASDLAAVDWPDAARCVDILADVVCGQGARLALELGVPASESLRFLETIRSHGVGVCFDIGNATALGFDAPAELVLLGAHVWHVHAKDKTAAQENVRFGTGEVRFAEVFAALAHVNFGGLVTMEATRGDDPVATAAEHRAFLLAAAAAARTMPEGVT